MKILFNISRLYTFYPTRIPARNSTEYVNLGMNSTVYRMGGMGRTAFSQGGYQMAALGLTLGNWTNWPINSFGFKFFLGF
jgi:hypothetical protein